jgi:hypothetical protein
MMFREEDDYKAFFKKAMKKFNVSDIEEIWVTKIKRISSIM